MKKTKHHNSRLFNKVPTKNMNFLSLFKFQRFYSARNLEEKNEQLFHI